MHLLMAAAPFSPFLEKGGFASVLTELFLFWVFCPYFVKVCSGPLPSSLDKWEEPGTKEIWESKFVRFLQSPQQLSFVL